MKILKEILLCIEGHAQQINGREGETASFLKLALLNSELCGGWFRPTSSQAFAVSWFSQKDVS